MALTEKEQVIFKWLEAAFVEDFGVVATNIFREDQENCRPQDQPYVTFKVLDDGNEGGVITGREEVEIEPGEIGIGIEEYDQSEILVAVAIFNDARGHNMHRRLRKTDKNRLGSLIRNYGFSLIDNTSSTDVTNQDTTRMYQQYTATYTFLTWNVDVETFEEIRTVNYSGETKISEDNVIEQQWGSTKPTEE